MTSKKRSNPAGMITVSSRPGSLAECVRLGGVAGGRCCLDRQRQMFTGLGAAAGGPAVHPAPSSAPHFFSHLVFTVPAPIAEIAFQNKTVVYGILFKAAAETLRLIAADPKHLGAALGLVAVLHTWGQNLTIIRIFTASSPVGAICRWDTLDRLPPRLLCR